MDNKTLPDLASAFDTLSSFHLADTQPFGESAEGLALDTLEQVYALTIALDVLATDEDPEIRNVHIGLAFRGIQTLLALSVFALGASGKEA